MSYPSATSYPSPTQYPSLPAGPEAANPLRGVIAAVSSVSGRLYLGSQDAPHIDLPTPLTLDPNVTFLSLDAAVTQVVLDG